MTGNSKPSLVQQSLPSQPKKHLDADALIYLLGAKKNKVRQDKMAEHLNELGYVWHNGRALKSNDISAYLLKNNQRTKAAHRPQVVPDIAPVDKSVGDSVVDQIIVIAKSNIPDADKSSIIRNLVTQLKA